LKSYPDILSFEKAILNKLVVDPEDFVGALRELPRNLLTMFVYAYQSYLFNRILSERIKQNLPLNKAIVGDFVLPIRKSVIDEKPIRVKENNIEKVNKQISNGKAAVSSVLFGSDSVFSEGEMGEIEHKVIDSEKIEPRDFIIPDIPFVSSSGMRRPLLAFVKNLDFKLEKDEHNKSKQALFLSFELQKGCYATSLLREFMKSDDIKNY
jgi:tRNA pseudouridine13 synthase